MIRDFCGIQKGTLGQEINALKSLTQSGKAPPGVLDDTLSAIDHVRQIGNIGAHMEKDINVIIDIDPDEAEQLIDLIEPLLEEWYIAANTRSEKLRKLGILAATKAASKITSPHLGSDPADKNI